MYQITVQVADGGTGALIATAEVARPGASNTEVVFRNTYAAVLDGVMVEGTKDYTHSLTGAPVTMEAAQFTFKLEGNGQELYAKNDANGNFRFQLSYTGDDIGNEYTYTVTEVAGDVSYITYDEAVYTVKIRIEDNGEGGLKITKTVVEAEAIAFENFYNVSGTAELVLDGTKTLTGRDLADGEFTFGLFLDGRQVDAATNKDGKFTLQATYTADDIGEYTYTVAETDNGAEYVTYDKTVYTVKVKVYDDGQGGVAVAYELADADKIAFVNTYEAPVVIPQTGDNAQLSLFITLMILSSFGIAALLVCKGKEEENNN